MPIYDYVCTACDHRTDILHGINDAAPRFCPSCGREGTLRKQFAPPTIHYKGSGWAKKDRGGSSSTRSSSGASKPASGSKDGDGGTTPSGNAASSGGASSGSED